MTQTADTSKIKAILTSQRRTVTVLSSLIAVQNELGYLPRESIPAIADYTDTSVNNVWGVATFYTHFRFEPPGEHSLELCWGPSCQLFEAKQLMKMTEEFAGVKFGQTTDDRKYSLRPLECAGACALAPVGKIDGTLIGRLSEGSWQQRLDKLANKVGASHG